MACGLRGIDHRYHTCSSSLGADFRDGIDGAERVGDVGKRKYSCTHEQRVKLVEIEPAVVARHGNVFQLCAGALGEELPWNDVAVMLQLGEKDGVTLIHILHAPSGGH